MKIGLSLYFCVLDIMDSQIPENEVKAIIVGSLYQRNRQEYMEAIAHHLRYYDHSATQILIRLDEQGKLVHPCIDGIVTPEWEGILFPFDAVDRLGQLRLKGLNEHWIDLDI